MQFRHIIQVLLLIILFNNFYFALKELTKRHNQLELAHNMLLRHHDKTQDLEYRQQKAVHALRDEQVMLFALIIVYVYLKLFLTFRLKVNTKLN